MAEAKKKLAVSGKNRSSEFIEALLSKGSKNGGTLTYGELVEALQDKDLSPDEIDDMYDVFSKKGIEIAEVTLHVGLGTFRPVKEENVLDHHMHSEFYEVLPEEAEKINNAKKNGHRVICVGTTSCRTIESAADENGVVHAGCADTEIFIYPGYKFKVLDNLITNFHLPESTLIMLVSALAGRENVLNAYNEAVKEKYRFFSFGDAMFITDL